MRALFIVAVVVGAAVLLGCGGEGRCLNPPCAAEPGMCASNADCFASQYCDFARDGCGKLDADFGECVDRPSACDLQLDRVCGCDGKFHDNQCAAESNGVDVSAAGGCTPPAGTFACGPRVCEIDSQVCFKIDGQPEAVGCQEMPEQCRLNPSCDCLENPSCPLCEESVGFTVTCQFDRPALL